MRLRQLQLLLPVLAGIVTALFGAEGYWGA